MAEIEFIYKGVKTIIQSNANEKIKDIYLKFKEKANIDNNKKIFYSYGGKIDINEELTFEEIANSDDKKRNKMNIVVFENESEIREKDLVKSKNTICPKCKTIIKMEIKDYKINLYDCEKRHKIENILLNEFEETQKINRLDIVCDICKKNNKSISYNNMFYKCLTCNKSICPLCKSNHNSDHKIINYDDKDYICNKHNDFYISFCENCKKNLCTLCIYHKYHKKINFIDLLPEKDNLIETMDELKKYINLFNDNIKEIINMLNEVTNKMNIYYKINEDIINNYNNKNRNYETIYYLNQFQKNNIIDELKNVIDCNCMVDKFNDIFNIYNKMNINEINIIYNTKGEKAIKLFGKDFVERNKNNCKLIIEGYEEELKEIYNFGYIRYFFGFGKDTLEFKLKGITNIINMSNMFSECTSLLSLPDISNWNTSNVTNMSCMFSGCTSLLSLPDISNWNTSNDTNISGMFRNCESLSSLPDISKWNISNVKDMSLIFSNCLSLSPLPDVSKWKSSKASKIGMFLGCKDNSSNPSN